MRFSELYVLFHVFFHVLSSAAGSSLLAEMWISPVSTRFSTKCHIALVTPEDFSVTLGVVLVTRRFIFANVYKKTRSPSLTFLLAVIAGKHALRHGHRR